MAPVYLYGYGNRRHIADPDAKPLEWQRLSYCGQWHDSEETLLGRFRFAQSPEKAVARKKAEPVCKRCQTAYDRAKAAG